MLVCPRVYARRVYFSHYLKSFDQLFGVVTANPTSMDVYDAAVLTLFRTVVRLL